MTRPLVLDASAMIALFDGYGPVYRLWVGADQGQGLLVLPAAAVAQANRTVQATADGWASLLWPRNVVAASLSVAVAIDLDPQCEGILATRQVIYEARATRGIVVTRDEHEYEGAGVPLLPV